MCSLAELKASIVLTITALPDDHSLYYGFSRFAIELNEILDSERDFLPCTDTRCQRYKTFCGRKLRIFEIS